MAKLLTIGEAAEAVGLTTSTLRYYDQIGLVRPAERVSGQRHYAATQLDRLLVINHCRQAGFTLDEIGYLLAEGDGWQARARHKRNELEQRIREFQAAMDMIEAALRCGCTSLEGCADAHRHGAHAHHTDEDLPPSPSLTDPTRPPLPLHPTTVKSASTTRNGRSQRDLDGSYGQSNSTDPVT